MASAWCACLCLKVGASHGAQTPPSEVLGKHTPLEQAVFAGFTMQTHTCAYTHLGIVQLGSAFTLKVVLQSLIPF